MATIANLQTLVTADTTSYVKNLDKAEKRNESFVKSLTGMKRLVRNVATGFGIERALNGIDRFLDGLKGVSERLGNSQLGQQAAEANAEWEKLNATWRRSADVLSAQLAPAIKSTLSTMNAVMSGSFESAIDDKIHKRAVEAKTFAEAVQADKDRVNDLTLTLYRAKDRLRDMNKLGAPFMTGRMGLLGMVGRGLDSVGMNPMAIAVRDIKALQGKLEAAKLSLASKQETLRENPNAMLGIEREAKQQAAAEARLKSMLTGGVASITSTSRGLFNSLATQASSAFSVAVGELDKLQKQLDGMKRDSASIFDATRNPLEQYESQLKRLQELLQLGEKGGGINQDTFDRAQAMALMDLDRATNSAAMQPRAIAALEKGTAAAFSAERMNDDPTEKTQREILEQAEQHNTMLREHLAWQKQHAAVPVKFPH